MVYYELLSDNTIGRSTPNKKIAESLGLSLQTDKEIVYGYDGKRYFKGEEPVKVFTKEEVQEIRKQLYVTEVDPITAHINRLRDEELTIEVAAEIAKLVEDRKVKVAEIKENNPYPEEKID
jgi:predicted transcriptional regulator